MNESISTLSVQEAFAIAGSSLVNSAVGFIPRLIMAILVFLIGWLLGGYAKSLTKKLLSAINIFSLNYLNVHLAKNTF